MPPPCALGSSRLRAVTAMGWLLGRLRRGVFVAALAVLAELDPVRFVLLVLQGGVVAPFADATGKGDDVFHSCLFGGEKEKSLGFLGAVNSSRGSRAPIDRTPGNGYKAFTPTARSPRRGSHAGIQPRFCRCRRLVCPCPGELCRGFCGGQAGPDARSDAESVHRAAVRPCPRGCDGHR